MTDKLNPLQFPPPNYSPGEIAAMEAEALRAKVAVPRPESLHEVANAIEDVREGLLVVLVSLRDRINETDSSAPGHELGSMFDNSVMVERGVHRLLSAERDVREVIRMLPSIRMRLNELGMSS